jgi:hypothetical protein
MPLPYVDCMACLYYVAAEATRRLGDPVLADRISEFAVQHVPQRYWCRDSGHRLLGLSVRDADNARIGVELRRRRRAAA